ncbi:MAG: hypothetical protein C0617_15765 [Desulfuromonas sp.]|uniref:hypothetical protein n=1 Tax=Desulfuromonas sp. TaxID=892 RepID=UPI000CB4C0D5|nr:hypothetical protein [Desulfuromonas sp.]PLX81971.1 MAG: hypothetical protein C0617_15765 [Desulfuromonas sp.]
MPINLKDLDVVPELAGVSSALIVPCNMCPAVTVALREGKPFIQLFKSFFKSAPFARHIEALQSRLEEEGIHTRVFNSNLPHHFFVCMWTSGRRKKLRKQAEQYEAVIVLGCDSATETVREAVESTDCKVVQGMEVVGFTNAKLKFKLPCSITFEDGKIIPISRQKKEEDP